ncbi:RNA polymerase sigma factor [Promineifilum sp.]|uniref:RNA polymerase sigma factor n=1 Tax=Promineifilum sp. TaxID=2664178 RepID=UPI0035B387DB
MLTTRTNPDWIATLSGQGVPQTEAIEELRGLLVRAALYTLVAHLDDLRDLDDRERKALAEDCAQEALMAVLSKLDDFRGDSKFTTWAYKFGVNVALTRARRERWKRVSLDALSENEPSLDWLQWKEEGLQTVDSEIPVLQAEVGALIQEVVNTGLTDRQRQVLKWIVFDEVPMDVVVERLDSNRNAVYKLLHDARLKVRRQLAAHSYEAEDVYGLFRRR